MVCLGMGGGSGRRCGDDGSVRRRAGEQPAMRCQRLRRTPRSGGDALTGRDDGGDLGTGLLRADLSAAAVEVAVTGFAAMWHGRTPEPGELLPGRAELAVEVLAELVASGRAEVDAAGRLVGVHGLTLRATRHHFVHAGRVRRTWCAFDSVGIPAALSLDATAHTDCPTCGRSLTVEVREGEASDNRLVLWLPAPDDRSNLLNDFCATADLYCSTEHLRERIEPGGASGRADLAAAVALGRDTWADVAGIGASDR
jgi:alkylmercury lyase